MEIPLGAGILTQIPYTATICNGTGTGASKSAITGIDAFLFYPGQQVSVNSGTKSRGAFTVSYVDAVGQKRRFERWRRPIPLGTIYSGDMLPEGTTAGDYLIVTGEV